MKKEVLTSILNEYDRRRSLFDEFTKVIESLVENLLKQNGLRVHSVFPRLKDRASLKEKLNRPQSKYEKIENVTDICGIRIITFFPDEVDIVASIISKEFDIDPDNSVDKRALLDPDRFGYQSLHYVVKLQPQRLKLTEYGRFSDCKVEIQIRSILQHTWAEIQHDLGYKTKIAVPKEMQRRFSQLAGLLELADDEFVRIRKSLLDYESSVKEKISKAPKSLYIDQVSLSFYIRTSSLVKRIESDIISNTKVKLPKEKDLTDLINRLNYAGFETIDDIETYLDNFQKPVIYFAEKLMGPRESREGIYASGISIFYLCYIRIASKGRIEDVKKYLDNIMRKMTKQEKDDFAKQLLSWYKDIA